MQGWRWRAAAGLFVLGAAAHERASMAAATAGVTATAGVHLALSTDGHIGAWLVAGSVDRAPSPAEAASYPRFGEPALAGTSAARWRLAGSNDGGLDVSGTLESRAYPFAWAAGVLRIERADRYVILLGGGDGVALSVDGKRVFSRDDPRPEQDDQDMIVLELSPGDHVVCLAVHRRGPWRGIRFRLLDHDLHPARGADWLLPGTTADDARSLAERMSAVSIDRGMSGSGYQAVLTVRYLGGAPRSAPLAVRARLSRAGDASGTPLYDVDAGQVAIDDNASRDLVVRLPRVGGEEVEDDDWTVHVEVAGRPIDCPFHPRRLVRTAAERAAGALRDGRGLPLSAGSLESIEHLRDRLVDLVGRGDADVAAEFEEARELHALAAAVETQQDPYVGRPWRKGVMRRAYRSPADGRLSEFGLYVPPDFDPQRTYPLIVALHGMNGRPIEMIMWLFGFDDPDHDGNWEDRHPRRDLPPLEAVVVAPDGHSNAMYRDVGEEDVMRVVDWAMATYPIDPMRVTITGPSMGGIGAAACGLHHPDRFAAAEPLCGYQSYFVRGDIGTRALRPWERFIAEERSNVFWAENGMYLPLYIVHGTKDLPEENSGVLIDRYTELNYDVSHEHPDLGHNVWQTTYEDLKGARWMLSRRRPWHPRALRFKTPSTRWADDAWLHVRELASSDAWGEVTARIDADNAVYVSTRGVASLALDRDPIRIDDAAPVRVGIDGRKLTFQAGEPIELHKQGSEWRPGAAVHAGLFKHGKVTGPIRDVFHEPLLFVWGGADPAQARANEEVARAWARDRVGVRVDYPVISDSDFYARGEALANERALFLVGNAASNRVVRELEPEFPIRVVRDEIVVGDRHFSPIDATTMDGSPRSSMRAADSFASQLGAAFIRPNPRRVDRYVVVIEGVGPLGTWRSLSLPDLLPDFVVFDQDVAAASGQLILGGAHLRIGGYFGTDWSVPIADPGDPGDPDPPARGPSLATWGARAQPTRQTVSASNGDGL